MAFSKYNPTGGGGLNNSGLIPKENPLNVALGLGPPPAGKEYINGNCKGIRVRTPMEQLIFVFKNDMMDLWLQDFLQVKSDLVAIGVDDTQYIILEDPDLFEEKSNRLKVFESSVQKLLGTFDNYVEAYKGKNTSTWTLDLFL